MMLQTALAAPASTATADDHGPRRRRAALLATGVVILLLGAVNVARDLLPAGTIWFSVLAAAALVTLARMSGLTWAQLGLGRERLRHGLAWGLGAIAVVGAVYAVGLLLPMTRSLFLDSRYHLDTPQALITAFVVIPLGTVLLEEVAFRGVLWGMLRRHMRVWKVLLMSSLMFGLWHVVPALGSAGRGGLTGVLPDIGIPATVLIVLGTVAFTALGGVIAGELRRRSGSVLASAGMHWATNALGVLFALGAWHLVG
jgi:membrane protease YdiL (CAAX protease family)